MELKNKILEFFKNIKLNKKKRNIITYSILIIFILLIVLTCYLSKQNSVQEFDVSVESIDVNTYTDSIIKKDDVKNNIDCKYYVYIILESVIVSGTIMYLIMSKNNEYKFKKTFINTDKVIIYTDSVILLSVAISLLSFELVGIMPDRKIEDKKMNYSYASIIKNSIDKKGDVYTTGELSKNALFVTGKNSVNLNNVTVQKSGNSKSINGNNSGLLINDNASVTIKDSSISTTSTDSEAIYIDGGKKYNSDTNILLNNSYIKTDSNNSIGINNNNSYVKLESTGIESILENSPLIVNNGKTTIKNGYYTTSAIGSPFILNKGELSLNKANIQVFDSDLIRLINNGKITINKSNLAGVHRTVNDDTGYPKCIFIYGENKKSKSEFTMKNSNLLILNGDTFFVTNTKATINLYSSTIFNTSDTSLFMRVQSNIFGDKNNNGGEVELNLDKQKIGGYIAIDEYSEIRIVAENKSELEVSINPDDQGKYASLYLDKTSKLTLLADTYLNDFTNKDKTNKNINLNGHKLYINGVSLNIKSK